MKLDEMVAEKLRALAQRDRPTDLSDVAMILRNNAIDEGRVRDLAARKFELVKAGDNRHRSRRRVQRPMQGHGSLGERRVGPLRVCTRPTSLGR